MSSMLHNLTDKNQTENEKIHLESHKYMSQTKAGKDHLTRWIFVPLYLQIQEERQYQVSETGKNTPLTAAHYWTWLSFSHQNALNHFSKRQPSHCLYKLPHWETQQRTQKRKYLFSFYLFSRQVDKRHGLAATVILQTYNVTNLISWGVASTFPSPEHNII